MIVKKKTKKQNTKSIVILILSILFYFYLSRTIVKHSLSHTDYMIFHYNIDASIVRGILSQVQMLISVFLVLNGEKKSFIAALVMTSISFLGSIYYVFYSNSVVSVPGIISYGGVLIIIVFIYKYKVKIQEQFRLLGKKEDELRVLAYFDGLTEIFNRKTFIDELDIHIDLYGEVKQKLYVIFIDIDDFKNINDTMGHLAGDLVLSELTGRIKSILHDEDIIGRLGGDELGIIIKHRINPKDVEVYIRKIQAAILTPYQVEGNVVESTASIGVAEFPKDGTTSKELLKKADIAMYRSKRQGKNKITFYE